MSNTIRERVDQLNSMIQQGKIMEAMNEFYADDLVMAENDNEPTVGLAANLEREHSTQFQIVLKGMGGFGNRVEGLLDDMIRGFEERPY